MQESMVRSKIIAFFKFLGKNFLQLISNQIKFRDSVNYNKRMNFIMTLTPSENKKTSFATQGICRAEEPRTPGSLETCSLRKLDKKGYQILTIVGLM